MTNEEKVIKFLVSQRIFCTRFRERWSALRNDPSACFEFGDKESPNYGKYGYQGDAVDGNRRTVYVSVPRLAALLFDMPLPSGRPGCGNKWCLNPSHFTNNPRKWAVRAVHTGSISDRILSTPDELREKLRRIGVLDNRELAKDGRRVNVWAVMSDGTRARTKVTAKKILTHLDALDAIKDPSQHDD
jgi:hypothetical protein